MWLQGEATYFLREGTANPTEKPGNKDSTLWLTGCVTMPCQLDAGVSTFGLEHSKLCNRLGVAKAAKLVCLYTDF